MLKKTILLFLGIPLFFVLTLNAAINRTSTQVQAVLDKLTKKQDLIGVQVGIYDTQNKILRQFSSGVQNRSSLKPLSTHHLMQIGSTTKSFISSLILRLQQEAESGELKHTFSIEQTIGDWLPEYTQWKDIPIRSLLNMTSGIVNYTEEPILFEDLSKYRHRIWTPIELIHVAYTASPNKHFPYGTKYEYSNTNYILLGQIIERVTGKSLEEVINEKLFHAFPKQFKHTSYAPLAYPRPVLEKMAHGYMMRKERAPFYHHDMTEMTLSWAGSAGAIISNAHDLAMWPALLFSEGFLNKKARDSLKKRVCVDSHCVNGQALPSDSRLDGYGLGIGYVHDKHYGDIWTHNGATLGYHTTFLYLPKKHLSMAVMINEIGPEIHDNDDVLWVAKKVLKALTI